MKKLNSFRIILFLIVALSISFFGSQVKAYYLINSHRNVNFTTSAFTDLNITLDRNGSYPSGNDSATISLTVANPNNYDVSYDLSFSNTDATYTIDGSLGATYTVLKNSSKTNVIEISGATGSSITITITSVLPYRKEFTKVVTFDNSNPTTSISSTTNIATSQTLTLSLEDASGLNSYYFGTDETPEDSDFTSLNGVTSATINETVSDAGRYYLITRDSVGNESVEYADFYRVDFNTLNQTLSQSYSIGKSGDSFTLPTPTANTGYTNEGNWYTNDTYTTGSTAYNSSYTISDSVTLYAKADANPLTFTNQTINKTYDASNSQTASIIEASNGTGSYTYSEVSEELNGSTSNYISLSGTTITIASNAPAGTYTYVINALDNNSASTTNATYTIVVARQGIDFPSCDSQVYNGSEQTLFAAHNSGTYTNNAIVGTNVGSYNGSLTPTSNYQWNSGDNPTSARTLTCSITQKKATITIDSSKTITYPTSDTMTFNYDGDGTLSCLSGDTTKVTCSITGTGSSRTLNLTPVAATSSAVTVTVSAGNGTNYSAADNKTTSVTVNPGALSGSVTITGTNTIGETLTANVTNTDNANLSYQWYASTTPGATSGGTPIVKAASNTICTRVTSPSDLHTETCSQSSNYCYADGYYSGGSKNTTTITYGSIWDGSSALKAGDAFDCDVNGNEVIDTDSNGNSTERFYYVSDRWNEGTNINSFDSNTAVLIYYRNYVSGAASDDGGSYDSVNSDNWHGPVTAVTHLPKTTGTKAWRDDLLTTRSRTIYACDNENCSNTPILTTSGGTITPNPFDYGSTTAARLLALPEVIKGCKAINENTSLSTTGSLSACNFLFERTRYANTDTTTYSTYGPWLETPYASTSSNVWNAYGTNRRVYYNGARYASRGVRPAIEVAKSELSASLGSSDAENEYTIESGMADKYIYVEVTAEKDNYTTATWKDATDATNNTTQAVAKKTATLSGLASSKTLTFPTADTMTFNYDGDGSLSCSTNTSYVTCNISGTGTSKTLTLTPVAVTSSAVTVTISAAAGTDYLAASNISTSVTVAKGTLSGSVSSISGTNAYGETLTAAVTNTNSASLSYQWYSTSTNGATSGGSAINGATSSTYTVGPGLVGKYLYVVVSATKANYNNATWSRAVSGAVAQRAITIHAKNQSIVYGNSISTALSQVEITSGSLASNDAISAITLAASTSNVTSSGTITPSAATIQKSGSTNVTSDYAITYTTGNLTITQKQATISNLATSKGLVVPGPNETLSFNYDGDGTVSCTSGDTTKVTCSVSGTGTSRTLTLTPVGATTSAVTVTVSATAGTNYSAPTSKTVSVTVELGVMTITLNNQSATTPGTAKIYEINGQGWYSDNGGTTAISTITIPTNTSPIVKYFGGYYTGTNGSGTLVIDASGNIVGANTLFSSDTTLYANWITVWANNLSFVNTTTGFSCTQSQCAIDELAKLLK